MSRPQAAYLHVCTGLVAASGAVFAWMKYAMQGSDEFAVVNHPLQPWMLAAHVVAAPLLVFGFGWIASVHIWPGFRQKRGPNRWSGIVVMAMIVPMALSGYLLQVMSLDGLRKVAAVTHWITSAIFVLGYAVHLLRGRSLRVRGDGVGRADFFRPGGGDAPSDAPIGLRRGVRSKVPPG